MNAYDWYKINYDGTPVDETQFEKPIKYRFDATQMRELRKPYKKLLKYADTMLKICNGEGMANDESLNQQANKYSHSQIGRAHV